MVGVGTVESDVIFEAGLDHAAFVQIRVDGDTGLHAEGMMRDDELAFLFDGGFNDFQANFVSEEHVANILIGQTKSRPEVSQLSCQASGSRASEL